MVQASIIADHLRIAYGYCYQRAQIFFPNYAFIYTTDLLNLAPLKYVPPYIIVALRVEWNNVHVYSDINYFLEVPKLPSLF